MLPIEKTEDPLTKIGMTKVLGESARIHLEMKKEMKEEQIIEIPRNLRLHLPLDRESRISLVQLFRGGPDDNYH